MAEDKKKGTPNASSSQTAKKPAKKTSLTKEDVAKIAASTVK